MEKTVQVPSGPPVTGEVVTVVESTERYSDIRLSDGAVLRIKSTASEALRIKGEVDSDGNPRYYAKLHTVIDLLYPPDSTEHK